MSSTCFYEVCRAGWLGAHLHAHKASVSRQSHLPSQNNVLSVESVQIFMCVLNDVK